MLTPMDVARMIAFIAIIIATLVPSDMMSALGQPDIQMVASTIVVGLIIFYDAMTGLLLGVSLLIAYFRMYYDLTGGSESRLRNGGPMQSLVSRFITPEHLESAQSNVVSLDGINSSYVGIESVYGEKVMDAQGEAGLRGLNGL